MFYFQLLIAYSVCYSEQIAVMLRKMFFWNNWIIKVGEVDHHKPEESYSNLYFFSYLMAVIHTFLYKLK